MDITFLKDVEIVRLRPHAHVHGRSAQYEVTYPDGREEIVLNVPQYDSNWQAFLRNLAEATEGHANALRISLR